MARKDALCSHRDLIAPRGARKNTESAPETRKARVPTPEPSCPVETRQDLNALLVGVSAGVRAPSRGSLDELCPRFALRTGTKSNQ